MINSKIKMWFFPSLFILICAVIISYIVTTNQNKKYEHFTEKNQTNIPKSYISSEKVKLLLPNLKLFLLSSYPVRKSIYSDWDKKYFTEWEDLSGNNNDITWKKQPYLEQKGFSVKDNSIYGPSNKLIFSDQITIIFKVELLEKCVDSSGSVDSVDIGEIINNASLSESEQTINIPSEIKETFENLKKDILSEEQNQSTLKDVIVNVCLICVI